VVRRVADRISALGYELACGPELEFYLCQADGAGRWRRYADDPGNVYVVGRKGDPQGVLLHMLRQLRDVGLRVTAANHEFSPGQFEINLGHSGLVDAADRSLRLKSAVQEIARQRDLLATFLPMRLGDALDALEADTELADVLGGYFVSSFLAYKRNEIERFERFVTDWEFREYAYHL
jgi:glutamine synthetase